MTGAEQIVTNRKMNKTRCFPQIFWICKGIHCGSIDWCEHSTEQSVNS